MPDFDNQLLREGFICLKAKEYDSARRYLKRALEMADDWETREKANFYLSQTTDDPVQKRKYLEEALTLNPTNAEVRRALAILDGKLKTEDIVDPDHLPAQSCETQMVGVDRFACPNCGSRMIFDGDGRTLVCESCTRQEALNAKRPENEQDFFLSMATGQGHRAPLTTKTFLCKGCGAQFVLPPEVISETCSYCASVHVVTSSRELVEPDSIIPMAFNQRQATMRLVKWVEKHKIKPEGKVQPPRGLYLPVWTFDMIGSIPWYGVIERNESIVRASGEKMVSFDDILAYDTPKLANLLPKIIKDFSLSSAIAYNACYLAGWPAEISQKSMAEASLDARKEAVERVRISIRYEESATENLHYSTANLSIVSFKLVLVPVWVTEYISQGRLYHVIINGQSGSIYGQREPQGIASWLGNLLGS